MAKQDSLNILVQGTEEKDKLAEILDGVLENVQASAISEQIKAKNGSGEPESGSVEYKRFANAELKDKGTARAAGKGDALAAKPVIVNIDTDKEIIEELQEKDVKLYGIAGMAKKRKANHEKRIKAYLDREFFAKVIEGTKVTPASTEYKDIIDNLISTAKATKNNYIDGIDAEDLVLVVNDVARKSLKDHLDTLPNGTEPKTASIGVYDSVTVYESTRLPENISVVVMMDGAIAQPYYVSEYDAEKIPLDDAIALESFLYKGTKALMPDTIYYYEETV